MKVADEDDRTALHTASMHGHTDCVDELLETGVSPDTATHTQHMLVNTEREQDSTNTHTHTHTLIGRVSTYLVRKVIVMLYPVF